MWSYVLSSFWTATHRRSAKLTQNSKSGGNCKIDSNSKSEGVQNWFKIQEECKIDCGAECALLCEIFFSCAAPGGEVAKLMLMKILMNITTMIIMQCISRVNWLVLTKITTTTIIHISTTTTIIIHISRVTWLPILRHKDCENLPRVWLLLSGCYQLWPLRILVVTAKPQNLIILLNEYDDMILWFWFPWFWC